MNDFNRTKSIISQETEWLKDDMLDFYAYTLKKRTKKKHRDENSPRMMTVKELAEATGISQYAIRKLCGNNEIHYIKSGVKILINYERFLEYMGGKSRTAN